MDRGPPKPPQADSANVAGRCRIQAPAWRASGAESRILGRGSEAAARSPAGRYFSRPHPGRNSTEHPGKGGMAILSGVARLPACIRAGIAAWLVMAAPLL